MTGVLKRLGVTGALIASLFAAPAEGRGVLDDRSSYKPQAIGAYQNEGPELERLVSYIRKKGIDVEFVPTEYHVADHGKWLGSRYANRIKVSRTKDGKPLTKEEQAAVLAHEDAAGFDHKYSDAKAQERAERFFREEYKWDDALRKVLEASRNFGAGE